MGVVVIGAGIGGLAAAARLARLGIEVTVLEAHVYPGGSAGTFYHQGYRFDAGATLAGGFYPDGPIDLLKQLTGAGGWQSRPAQPAMVVHLPGNLQVARLSGEERWDEYRSAFGRDSLGFWKWQEQTAAAMWDLAMRMPPWPPQGLRQVVKLAGTGLGWLYQELKVRRQGRYALRLGELALDAFRSLDVHLASAPQSLRMFIDAQLLISAQTDSRQANALYGAAALDLPNREVVHLEGGMGSFARGLAAAVEQNGGRVLYRQEAVRIRRERGRPAAVETRRGGSFPAGAVLANLTPWNAAALMIDDLPALLRKLPALPDRGWGAFVLYAGLDGGIFPSGFPLHHQVVAGPEMGEGKTVFISVSPEWDAGRAPAGGRAATMSTHTRLEGWWELYQKDRAAYEARKQQYARRLLEAAENVLPGVSEAAGLLLPGTPVTFQRFTRRVHGWVGGFPQTGLFESHPARIGRCLWLVGDSIFPGQSVAAAVLGGLRVAEGLAQEIE